MGTKTKSMFDLFQPLKLELDLKAERPYFEIDGARTYLITEDGEIAQNAVAALVQAKVEKKKYETFFEKLKDSPVKTIHEDVPVQAGDYPAEAGVKNTKANIHSVILEKLAKQVFTLEDGSPDEEAVKALMKTCVDPRTKKVIIVNGEPV